MKPAPLALAALLSGCVTSPDETPLREVSRVYYENTTVCTMRFQEYRDIPAAEACPAGQARVAVGFMVEPIKGDCEAAFITRNKFRQIYGCLP